MYHGINRYLKPRANGRNVSANNVTPNIVGCYMLRLFAHPVACCCAKFKTGQTFQPTTPNISFVLWSPKRSATMLDPFAQLFQHCWGHAGSLCKFYKDLWFVSFPPCTVGPNIVGSCCIRLHAARGICFNIITSLITHHHWSLSCHYHQHHHHHPNQFHWLVLW